MSDKFNMHTTAQEVGDAFADNIKGKFIVITGVSRGGIGHEDARVIASKGPKLLVLASRSQTKMDETKEDILKETSGAKIETVLLDLESLDSVRSAAKEILALGNPEILINNAAVMACPYSTTKEGFEYQFGVNYVAPWLFTNLLLPAMLKTSHPRVVFVSSVGHQRTDIRWDDIGYENGKVYDPRMAYGQSKTASVLNALQLAETHGDRLISISLHPGAIGTNLMRFQTEEDLAYYGDLLNPDGTPNMATGIWKTIPEGAATSLVAAFDPRMEKHNGAYLANCQVARNLEDIDGSDPEEWRECLAKWGRSKEGAQRLWDLTNKLLGTNY